MSPARRPYPPTVSTGRWGGGRSGRGQVKGQTETDHVCQVSVDRGGGGGGGGAEITVG